jgi:hypothetical protein
MSSQVTSRFVPYPEQVRFSTLKRWNLSTCFGNHITNTKKHKNSLFTAQRSFALQIKQGSASGGRAFGEPSFSAIIRGVRLPTVAVFAKVGVIRMLKVINQFIPGAPGGALVYNLTNFSYLSHVENGRARVSDPAAAR